MECKKCQSKQIVKSGFKPLAEGKVQRYRCQECGHYFTGVEKYHRLTDEQKELIEKMYDEKGELRKIARVLGIHLSTVQWHLKKSSKLP
jgi:transposase-like protein